MSQWNPPEFISREQCIKDTEEVLGLPDIPITSTEDIFRINVLGMDWDMGMVVHQPVDASKIPTGADGKKIGFFLLHGGSSDFKGIERHAKLLASKYGCRVVAGTFPGRFYFPDPSRDWPDDTIHADGTVRTPIWKQGELIGPDQYTVVKDPIQAQPLRHAHAGESKAGNDFLVPHGRLAGGVRSRHDRSLQAPLSRR